MSEETTKKNCALVVLSGGQDSVTCLGYALKHYKNVFAISFLYGQRHEVELKCAKSICAEHDVPLNIVDVSFLGNMVTSALTGKGSVNEKHVRDNSLPASFVPNRNALFLTVAHAYAQEVGASSLITGVCQTDYSGYPDCRAKFIRALQTTLNIGYNTGIQIVTPLMNLTKAETFKLAEEVGFLEVVINESHTCYNGDHETLHDWGYGCAECPACGLRAKGYEEYLDEFASDRS